MSVVFVKIKDPKKPGGKLVLAERDFDPAKHELFVEGEAAKKPAAVPPAATATTSANAVDDGRAKADAFVNDIVGSSVKGAAEKIADIVDAGTLDAIEAAENAGAGRAGVLKAIAAKRKQLTSAPGQ